MISRSSGGARHVAKFGDHRTLIRRRVAGGLSVPNWSCYPEPGTSSGGRSPRWAPGTTPRDGGATPSPDEVATSDLTAKSGIDRTNAAV
jgi:hypothetical protein